jgi:hypothetical protein
MGCSRVLDSRGDLVCTIVPEGQILEPISLSVLVLIVVWLLVFRRSFWKWHRRLGHLSFDLLSCLSGLGLARGLPKLKYQKDLLCAPCRHGKMVDASHPPLTSVMT